MTKEEFAELVRGKSARTAERQNTAHRAKRDWGLKRFVRHALDAYIAELALAAAETEHKISRVEAAAVDGFQTDMANIVETPEERQQIRDTALTLAQAGIAGTDDVADMITAYHIMQSYGLTVNHLGRLGRSVAARREL